MVSPILFEIALEILLHTATASEVSSAATSLEVAVATSTEATAVVAPTEAAVVAAELALAITTESAAARSLIAFALALVHRNEPRRFLRTLFYLCLPQILLESLRTDAINLLFVHIEQLLCYLFVEGVLVWYGFRCGAKRFSSWIPALAGLAVCGLTVMEEFMLEGKILLNGSFIPQWITYALMAAGLAVLAVEEHRANRRLLQI